MIHLFIEYMQRDIDIKLWTDQPLNTISGYYSITAKCVTDTIKGYDTLGMQYADKYKGVDQRLGLLSLAGVKYITVAHNSQVAKDVSSKGDVPYGVEKQSKKEISHYIK